MRFAILGSGAVGGYFGARLARAGQDVTFIARGAHLEAIRSKGLEVKSAKLGDFIVRAAADSDTARVGPVDVAVVSVKAYDNLTALPMLAPMMGPETVVLTLQNGVDSVDEVAAVVGGPRVLGGTTYVATALEAPGLIVQTGVHRSIIFGEVFGDRRRITPRVQALADVLATADIQVTPVPDARVPIWDKFVYLVAFSGFTGAARLPIGHLWKDPRARDTFYACSREVAAIAKAEGVTISANRFDTLKEYMDHIPPTTRSSLLIDLEQGKRIEVEALQGAAVRRAQKHGLPTPIISTLYAVLKPWEEGPARK
ncbi:MAG: 2-dehydropantoate 2-reductase [Acidobacteria bacterium RIFCSPLOWO2_12_FULL_67_14b]|nr:MAG: 2-dehydropantoate 2-reductase [Acidobacteria bacterium RIFCSPLOWO2_12_FULL_67_14b]